MAKLTRYDGKTRQFLEDLSGKVNEKSENGGQRSLNVLTPKKIINFGRLLASVVAFGQRVFAK